MVITIHGVLAGAYARIGDRSQPLLTHASEDGGETALCRRVKEGNLCDREAGESLPSCRACRRRMLKKLTRDQRAALGVGW